MCLYDIRSGRANIESMIPSNMHALWQQEACELMGKRKDKWPLTMCDHKDYELSAMK